MFLQVFFRNNDEVLISNFSKIINFLQFLRSFRGDWSIGDFPPIGKKDWHRK